jgi:hypothetical protein
VEDQEPYDEGHAVSCEIEGLGEDHLLEPVQPEDPRLITRELARAGQGDADADRYPGERQRLLEQVRPALALPGPPADHVADGSAGEPAGCPGLPGRDVQQLADEVGQLGGGQCQHSCGREADQPPATGAAQPPANRPGDHAPHAVSGLGRFPDRRGTMHARPRRIQALGSVRHGIQYGNLRRPGKHRISRRTHRSCPAPPKPYRARTCTGWHVAPPGCDAARTAPGRPNLALPSHDQVRCIKQR